jgi:hypothetical protein
VVRNHDRQSHIRQKSNRSAEEESGSTFVLQQRSFLLVSVARQNAYCAATVPALPLCAELPMTLVWQLLLMYSASTRGICSMSSGETPCPWKQSRTQGEKALLRF